MRQRHLDDLRAEAFERAYRRRTPCSTSSDDRWKKYSLARRRGARPHRRRRGNVVGDRDRRRRGIAGSWPAIACSVSAASRTVRAGAPRDRATTRAETRRDGSLDRTSACGRRCRSDRRGSGSSRRCPAHRHEAEARGDRGARAALDPPGCDRRPGVATRSKCALFDVEPNANSCMLFLPTMTAPAAFSFAVTTASAAGTCRGRCASRSSLRRRPCRTGLSNRSARRAAAAQRPAAISLSAVRAAAIARSAVTVMKDFRRPSTLAMRSRAACVTSTGDA